MCTMTDNTVKSRWERSLATPDLERKRMKFCATKRKPYRSDILKCRSDSPPGARKCGTFSANDESHRKCFRPARIPARLTIQVQPPAHNKLVQIVWPGTEQGCPYIALTTIDLDGRVRLASIGYSSRSGFLVIDQPRHPEFINDLAEP
jgi:hypothetical protein